MNTLRNIVNDYYDKQPKPAHFRNGPLNEAAIADLRKNDADFSITTKEDGKIVTEYFKIPPKETV